MKALALGIVAASLSVSAFADVAYSSFGPSDSFTATSGWTIGGTSGTGQRVAFQFTSASTGVLNTVEYAAFGIVPGDINVLLHEDNSGVIGNQMVAWGASLVSGPASITTLTNVFPSVALTAGNKYWLEIRGVTNGVWGGWNFNDQGLDSNAFSANESFPAGNYSTLQTAAFRVTTGVVPEPASMAALGLGALALVRKRRKNA